MHLRSHFSICSLLTSLLYRHTHSVRKMTKYSHEFCLNEIRKLIPPLSSNSHKGQSGRIGIVGGSIEYTGAPYFSAISALKTGADLVHVFCCKEAGPVIKSYSPELIVHPCLDSVNSLEEIKPWLPRLHALVIGPGLGHQRNILDAVSSLITYCKSNTDLPLVIDADGLFLLSENKNIIHNYREPIILTPNKMELKRLAKDENYLEFASELNVILVEKGKVDKIYNGLDKNKNGDNVIECNECGSNRRCGGQGDLLSGASAVFLSWFHNTEYSLSKYSLAAYAACCLTRECSRLAFIKQGRSMTTSDMILEIHSAFMNLFGEISP